ncbi:MAG: shikimate dehydrogenase [Verrucomicrobia bacterium]|nr:shikimate dehydrogenase [Verrucomicrobiota bacterium]
MHNAAIAALGLDWRYLAFDVRPEELRQAVAGAQVMRFIGLNLTLPHKLLAVDMMDELDESAREWGAVNTIRFEARKADGDWVPLAQLPPQEAAEIRRRGFNTDADALVRALQEDLACNFRGATVLVLGAGGAGRVAALRLAAEQVKRLFLVNRTPEKAKTVGAEIERRFPAVQVRVGYPDAAVDLIVNATSLGLRETDPVPMDERQFQLRKAGAVFDMIYQPAETPLLQAAKAAGCRVANGLGMLLYQGARALELWVGQAVPVHVMRKALEEQIYGSRQSR